MVGQNVSHYHILEKIDEGGMGIVYRAYDERLRREVALKCLPERFLHDDKAVERFTTEARAASALNHPHIVTIHDIGEAAMGRFIVMELIKGRTLRAMAAGLPALESVVQWGRQVAGALAAAHAAGIVHRDIKPENIMIRDDGSVKVVDFGVARLAPAGSMSMTETAAATRPGSLLGTVHYMSPSKGAVK
jgi:serine/threonine protein kinase